MNLQFNKDKTVLLEDVRIVYRNFAGKEGAYNREGDRSFSVVLDDKSADQMTADNWNVKTKPPREEGEDPFHTLPVAVSFKGRAPRIVLISSISRKRTELNEETCVMIDYSDILGVDLIIRPYDWSVNGNSGRKAYLKTIYVTINEDYLDLKYSSDRFEADDEEILNEDYEE